jgi:hypothetical protein
MKARMALDVLLALKLPSVVAQTHPQFFFDAGAISGLRARAMSPPTGKIRRCLTGLF